MPSISEEDEIRDMPDFSELLDLPDAAFSATSDPLTGTIEAYAPSQMPEDTLRNGFIDDWDVPEANINPNLGLEEPDYGKFENWIPQFIRPEKPCDYCRVRRLNCYITRGETGCTPCNALFRDCSLHNSRTLEANNQSTGYLLDTLHVVDEDTAKEWGTLTGIKRLQSKTYPANTANQQIRADDAPGSSKRNGIRFPRHAIKILRDWMDTHEHNPYPSEIEKADLEKRTDLKPSQIANWLANARRRRKVSDNQKSKVLASPSLKATTAAIAIPGADKPWDELNPFERWKNSPPEHEPAAMTDIANAVANSDLPADQVSTSPSSQGRRKKRSSNGSGFSNVRAPSTTSFETGQSSSRSATNSAVFSQHSSQSHGSFGSFSSGLTGKRDRRRRRRPAPAPIRKNTDDQKKRIFQCTFCTDSFKSKYDWTRHEKSLHLSLEKWICAPLGPIIIDALSGQKRCVYCDELDPSNDHLETHNHRQCEEKGHDARTFYRKDHLRQHLRLMHGCDMTDSMDNWKFIAVNINSRCGFCSQRFSVWQERVDHLTAHFKAGARMAEWKGCRGLDPAVAAQVTNAMPPYLIGMESVSPNPFTASNKSSMQHCLEIGEGLMRQGDNLPDANEYSTKSTCWEILTVRLGKYANQTAKKGIVLTDEMLQAQARRILFDSDDSWNQTAADNPEWLDLFKKAHGLDFIPDNIGGQGTEVPEDLETYGDLGLRIPFAVQLKAYNDQLYDESCTCGVIPGHHTKSIHDDEKKTEDMRILYRVLAREGVLHDEFGKCKHSECDKNLLEVSTTGTKMSTLRWCSYDLTSEKARKVAKLIGSDSKDVAKSCSGVSPVSASPSPTKATEAQKKPYLQRHRYELPRDRAQRFATTTGAWNDSGMMPEATTTLSMPSIYQQNSTTTGAMMEFLGGDVGQTLPFSSDVHTSSIALPSTAAQDVPMSAAEETAMMYELDRLMAENTQAEQLHATTAEMDFTNDFSMDDLHFDDMDLNFDGVFDMPLDETFGLSGQA